MLQTVCMSPELLVNQNMSESEICGYSPGQGSPLPGETASPKSCFQQSPSLPDSGLTELNVASPKIYHPPPPPPCNPPGMPAPADSELSSDPPQKRYMGVRVKMPVRELLRKIRLSKGLEPAPGKEASSVKMVAKGSSGKTAEKRRSHPYTEKQLRQSKQSAGQSPKGLEDLDILVEVLQEDLNQSQLGEEPRHPVPDGFGQGFSRELQSCRWQSAGSKEAAGGLQGRQQGPAEPQPQPWGRDCHPILRGQAEPSFHGQQESIHRSGSPGMFSRTGEEGSSWWVQDGPWSSQEDSSRNAAPQEGFLRNSASQGGFSRNSASQEYLLRNSAPQEYLLRNSPSQECFLRNSAPQEGLLRNSPSHEGLLKNSAPQECFLRNSPSQESFLMNSAPQEGLLRNSPSQECFLRNSPSQECFLRNSPSQEGPLRNSPSQECFLRNSPSQEGLLRNSPSQEGLLRNSPSQEGLLRNSPSQEGLLRNSPSQDTPALPSLAEMLLEAPRGSPDVEGPLRLTPNSFPRQDLSALSFFQFQLRREENLLRNIPEETLLAPDENGNRLLHKAVAQGRRALTFALAQRFASLNKIDEKDAEERTALHLAAEKNQHLMVSDLISLGANVNEQDSSGKTPLHLCAEHGYLRVLQVLKSCKNHGVCVEVDVPDHHGLTPLHCAALAHSVLVTESQSSARDSSRARLLRLRRAQILEGILCLLQMGAKPQLQVLNSCQASTPCLKLEENTELMCLLQTHQPQAQDVPQESCSLLDAPRGIPTPPAADNLPGLCSLPSSDLLDVLLKALKVLSGFRGRSCPCPDRILCVNGIDAPWMSCRNVQQAVAAWPAARGGAEHGNDGECPGGARCKGGERSPGCPAGFFCPAGNSSGPLPCPPGTFGPAGAAGPPPGCRPCPAGSFNPRPGQSSCLPCGSGAAQPAEGQSTCVCPGAGQVYQPRDGRCTCPPGFRSSGRDGDVCVRKSYPVCRDSASRTQEGQCLTRRGWARYCSQKVCAAPRDFRGYDKVLGLCLCGSESLESICNSRCREQQKSTLQLLCAGKTPQLRITHSNGSKSAVSLEGLRKVLPRPNFSLEDVCAAGQQIHPAHVVEMSGKGFLGVYNPDPELIQDLLVQGEASAPQEMNPPSAAAPDPPGPEECREQTRSPPNCTAQPPFRGILNPIACSSSAVTLLFLLTPQHFPLYDVDSLFNTNAEFDWGDFRSLREEIREIPRNSPKFLLFLFQFQAPGTYVLQLSSNKHKRMYVRVLAAGLRCPDGPFLPGSPRAALRAGLAPRRQRELRLRPDRAALAAGMGMGMLLLLLLLLPLLCPAPGRVPRGPPSPGPSFRRRQLRHSLDRFSSQIPAVISRRKPRPCCSTAGTAPFPGRAEPWEPQMDLEDFNTKLFFELLLRQSQSVTTTLGRFKEEVKVVYHGVMREISSLKKLWLKAPSVPAEEEEEEEEAKEQAPLSGSPSQSPRICGISDTPSDPRDSIPPRLIPLLQSLLQMLQESRKSNFSPESPGYSSRSTLTASAAPPEVLKRELNQETIPASTAAPALLPSPAGRIPHLQQEMQKRFLWEKHSWERAQLEMALLAQEMGTLCSFYQSHKGLQSGAAAPGSLLAELSERHSRAGQALLQRHLEEAKRSELSPELAVPKQPQHFLQELPQQLSFCLPSLLTPDRHPSQQQEQPRDAEHSLGSVPRLLQVSGMKIVKLEALRQRCLYRVLDLYSHLQAGACPEAVRAILSCQSPAEEVAQEVAESREQQQAARAVTFLQEHHQEGPWLKGLNAEAQAGLRKMQEQFRLELQSLTEEKLEAREAELLRGTAGQSLGDLVAQALRCQRHLRQVLALLRESRGLRSAALRGPGPEPLLTGDSSLDEDSREILQLLQDNTEYLILGLDFIQAARLLQLRETHSEETIRSLKCCRQEKFVDDANITISEVKKFREQKMRKLKEQLKHFLEEKKTENILRSFDPFQARQKDRGERRCSRAEHSQPGAGWAGDGKGEQRQQGLPPAPRAPNPRAPGTPSARERLRQALTAGAAALRQAGQLLASRTLPLQLPAPPRRAESHNRLMKKNQNFLHLLSSGRQSLGQKAHPGGKTANSLSRSELEDEVDALTEELLRIVEDEEQFLNSKGNEDLLSYYLEITSLEKESLVTQINALEEEIAQGRKL